MLAFCQFIPKKSYWIPLREYLQVQALYIYVEFHVHIPEQALTN
jgi:hypothetical protein